MAVVLEDKGIRTDLEGNIDGKESVFRSLDFLSVKEEGIMIITGSQNTDIGCGGGIIVGRVGNKNLFGVLKGKLLLLRVRHGGCRRETLEAERAGKREGCRAKGNAEITLNH